MTAQRQATGGIPVETMAEPRRLGQAKAQGVQVEFQMVAAARAAMDRQAGRFVENDDQAVPVEDTI